jgi:hypothetical protein
MIMSLASVPNVIVVDMANMVVAHSRNRGYNVFQPFDGRVAECNSEKVEKASNGEFAIDWPWFPNGTDGSVYMLQICVYATDQTKRWGTTPYKSHDWIITSLLFVRSFS